MNRLLNSLFKDPFAACEDLIFLENLKSTIILLDEDVKVIQESSRSLWGLLTLAQWVTR